MRTLIALLLGMLLGSAIPAGMAQGTRLSGTQSLIANVTGPAGVRIELSELTPESLQRKAIDGWR